MGVDDLSMMSDETKALMLAYLNAENAAHAHRVECHGYCRECERLIGEAQVEYMKYMHAKEEEELTENA